MPVRGNRCGRYPLAELHPFRDHPLQACVDDDRMLETAESITRAWRARTGDCPASARKGGYEIIAGHRRKRACELAGLDDDAGHCPRSGRR